MNGSKTEQLAKKYFLNQTNNTHIQFFRYIFVGGLATVVDMGSLFILSEKMEVYYLFSAALAFLLGLVVNYLLSIIWVFKSTGNIKKEFAIFSIIGVGGLVWNEIIIWFLVDRLAIYFMLAKAISVILVLFWNFGMRKKFVF